MREHGAEKAAAGEWRVPDQPGLYSNSPVIYYAAWRNLAGRPRGGDANLYSPFDCRRREKETGNAFLKDHIYCFFSSTLIMNLFPLTVVGTFDVCIQSFCGHTICIDTMLVF